MISKWMCIPFLSVFQGCFILNCFWNWQPQGNLENWKTKLQKRLNPGYWYKTIQDPKIKSSACQKETCLYQYFSTSKFDDSPNNETGLQNCIQVRFLCRMKWYTNCGTNIYWGYPHLMCSHNGAPGVSAGKQSCTNHLCRGWVGRFHFLYCLVLANRCRGN